MIRSYVTRTDTGAEVPYIKTNWDTKTFNLLTEDLDFALRSKNVEFAWKIDLTGD